MIGAFFQCLQKLCHSPKLFCAAVDFILTGLLFGFFFGNM